MNVSFLAGFDNNTGTDYNNNAGPDYNNMNDYGPMGALPYESNVWFDGSQACTSSPQTQTIHTTSPAPTHISPSHSPESQQQLTTGLACRGRDLPTNSGENTNYSTCTSLSVPTTLPFSATMHSPTTPFPTCTSQDSWRGGHANKGKFLIEEVLDFDLAIGKALDFAKKDGNTLVIVTADHETGGFALSATEVFGQRNYGQIKPTFSTGGHTASLIPVFAYGPGAERFMGVYQNNDIYQKMMDSFSK